MANDVDISERWLLDVCPEAVQALLVDHTTGQNIYWATESYAERGEGFQFIGYITIEKNKKRRCLCAPMHSDPERKELDSINKQIDECMEYHNRLLTVDDAQQVIDLDDSVVINYAKCGSVVSIL